MGDVRLRRRERAAMAGGAAETARLLGERLRHGSLAPERLELARQLGDAAAQLVIGPAAPVPSLEDWGKALAEWGPEVEARAALAVGEAMLPLWEGWEPGVYAPGVHLRWAVRAAHALVVGPREDETWRVADGALLAAEEAVERTRHHLAAIEAEHPGRVGRSSWRPADAGWVLVCAVRACLSSLRVEGKRVTLRWALAECPADVGEAVRIREAVRDALVPWALAGS